MLDIHYQCILEYKGLSLKEIQRLFNEKVPSRRFTASPPILRRRREVEVGDHYEHTDWLSVEVKEIDCSRLASVEVKDSCITDLPLTSLLGLPPARSFVEPLKRRVVF